MLSEYGPLFLRFTGHQRTDGFHSKYVTSPGFRDRTNKLSLRVQVPNNHILAQNLYYNYDYPNPKYLIIGYMDPLGNKLRFSSATDIARCTESCLGSSPKHAAAGRLGRPLKYLTFSRMALIRDPIYSPKP